MPPCIASGYSILEKLADGTYAPKYVLDDESNAMAVKFFEESTKEDDYEVVVEGSDCGGTVAIATMALASDAPTDTTPPDATSSAHGLFITTVGSSLAAFAFAALRDLM